VEGGSRNEASKVTLPAGRLFPAHNTKVCSRSLLVWWKKRRTNFLCVL